MKVSVGKNDLVVVCDGAKALFLENRGDSKFPNLRTREVLEHKGVRTSQLGSDRPGRVQQSAGSARAAVAQTDWHDDAEVAFLQSVVTRLEGALQNGGCDGLIVIAPPRALGVLRHAYSPALRKAIKFELDKDLVRTPIHEIETMLTQGVVN